MEIYNIEVRQLQERRLGPTTHVAPFEDVEGFRDDWWSELRHTSDEPSLFFAGFLGDQEVARATVDEHVFLESYPAISNPHAGFAEIVFLEVVERARRTGVGAAFVGGILNAVKGQRFIAFSEGADDFWNSLGWFRHDAEDKRPLFVSDAFKTSQQ